MARMSGNRWLGILIAVIAIGALGLYASNGASNGISHPAASAVAATATTTPAETGAAAPTTEPFTATTTPPPSTVTGLSPAAIVGLVLKIGIVAALLGLCLWLLRRYAGTSSRSGGRTGAVAIVDTIPLAQGRAMYVLDIGDRAILVGATPQQFSLLGDVTDESVLARLRGARERSQPSIGAVSQQFSGLLQRFSGKPAPAAPAPRQRLSRPAASDVAPTPPHIPASNSFASTLASYTAAEPEAPQAAPLMPSPERSPQPRRQTEAPPAAPPAAQAPVQRPGQTGIAAQQRAAAPKTEHPAMPPAPARPRVPVERLRTGEGAL